MPDYLFQITGLHHEQGEEGEPDETWAEESTAMRFAELPTKSFCGGCGMILSTSRPTNIRARFQVKARPMAGWGGGTCIGFAMLEFLHELDWPFMSSQFHLGEVTNSRGELQEGVVTFVGKEPPLFVRGLPGSDCGICSLCTRRKYYAMPPKHRHLASGALTGAPIYWSDDGQLIVTAAILKRIDRKKWRQLAVIKLPVFDKPLDGLPDVFWP